MTSVTPLTSTSNSCPVFSADQNAPTSAFFRCCLCRRGVSIDTRTLTCDGIISRIAATGSAVDGTSSVPLSSKELFAWPQGSFLRSSREHSKRYSTVSNAAEEHEKQDQDQEEHEEEMMAATSHEAPVGAEETHLRHPHHIALRGSQLSAAGKYGPLCPAILSPLPTNCRSRSRRSRSRSRRKRPCDGQDYEKSSLATAVAESQSQIVAQLAPAFAYMYGWFGSAEVHAFVCELWRMFHDGPVPAPAASSPLTVQRDDFASTHETMRPLTQTTRDFSNGSIAASLKLNDAPWPIHSTAPSSAAVVVLPPPPSLDALEAMETASPVFYSHSSSHLYSHSHPATQDLYDAALDGRGLDGMPLALLSLERVLRLSSATASSTTPFITRERFLTNFTSSLMRRVVHASGVDLPLCLRCWTEALVARQKETARITEDVVSLASCAQPDEESLILSCQMRTSPCKERTAPVCGTVESEDAEEGFQRLMIEVQEAEARKELFKAECIIERRELDLLLTKRQEKEAEERRNWAAHNAQEVKNFFEQEDVISGITRRIQNTMSSCAFLTRSHAMLLAFPINTSGPVATIAGLRLGQVPSPPSNVSRRNKNCSSTLENKSFPSAPAPSLDGTAGSYGYAPSAWTVESNKSSESIALLHMLLLQRTYTQNLLGSREDRVSVAEINCACGFLLQLLQHLADRHHMRLQTAIFELNGDRSKVDVFLSTKGNPPKPSGRQVDFFINENFFSWKTFGTGCAIVATCVQEIASILKDHLAQLRRQAENVRSAHPNAVADTIQWDTEDFVGQLENDDDVDWWVLHSTTPEDPPFVIEQGRVDGFSVRHGDASEGVWTIGMKKLLSVVQWCVLASRDIDVFERLLENESRKESTTNAGE